ncbi:unnamed protein product, partial [Didymodactylos carnosus]
MLFHLSVAHLPEYSLVKNNHRKRIDFQVLKLLLKLLEPLEDVTREVSSATTATLSLVLPVLVAILTLLEPDSSVLDKMKTFMKTQLEKWFNKSFSNKFYLLTCIVDSRFKHFTFTDPNNFSTNGITASTLTDWKSVGARKIAEQLLKDEYQTISTTILGTSSTTAVVPLCLPPRPLSVLDKIVTRQQTTASSEYTNYLSEPEITTNTCALIWCNQNKHRYPTIAKIARKYLCIRATSTPLERIFSLSGFITIEPENKICV